MLPDSNSFHLLRYHFRDRLCHLTISCIKCLMICVLFQYVEQWDSYVESQNIEMVYLVLRFYIYTQVRAEVSILSHLNHPNVIEFVGVVLHPLCFILEWAPGGSLKSIIEKYRKVDARISPMALQNSAYQVKYFISRVHLGYVYGVEAFLWEDSH